MGSALMRAQAAGATPEGTAVEGEVIPAATPASVPTKLKGGVTGKGWPKGVSGNPGGSSKQLTNVRNLARTHTEDAIRTLAEVMLKTGASESARVLAANSLLDRAWGKPLQMVAGEDGEGPVQMVMKIITGVPRDDE